MAKGTKGSKAAPVSSKGSKRPKPRSLSNDQLAKISGGYFRCSSVWCCSLGSNVPGGCTGGTAMPQS